MELFLTTATPPSSSNILINISLLLPSVLKMSQQQVGSLILTIDVGDLMSILYRNVHFHQSIDGMVGEIPILSSPRIKVRGGFGYR